VYNCEEQSVKFRLFQWSVLQMRMTLKEEELWQRSKIMVVGRSYTSTIER